MNNWKKYKLEEITSKLGDGLHGTPQYDEYGEYFFINGSNLIDGRIVIDSRTKRVKKDQYDKYKKELSERTILLGINGTIGNVALFNNEKCILGKSACYINVDTKFDKNFVKYILLNDDFQDYIKANATGSVIRNVGLKLLREYEVMIPSDMRMQTRIASILSSLDDKIELNRRMNQTLEQMAQALFNHYFVDNIDPDNLPEGWRWGKLGELISLTYGKALKEEQRKGGIFPVVGSSGIVGYHNESIGLKNGIVVGRKGNAGSVIWMHDAFFPIDTTFYVSDLLKIEGFYFYYFLLKKLNLKSLNSDSAVPGLNRNEAHAQEIVIPERTKIAQFNNSTKILFEKIKVNETEIKTLTLIRDTLLPKLMSGEIDVDKIVDEEELIENELADCKTA